jgi:hypothetical protein
MKELSLVGFFGDMNGDCLPYEFADGHVSPFGFPFKFTSELPVTSE